MAYGKKDLTKEDFIKSLKRRGDVSQKAINQIREHIFSRKGGRGKNTYLANSLDSGAWL
jgi:hypothetical protein